MSEPSWELRMLRTLRIRRILGAASNVFMPAGSADVSQLLGSERAWERFAKHVVDLSLGYFSSTSDLPPDIAWPMREGTRVDEFCELFSSIDDVIMRRIDDESSCVGWMDFDPTMDEILESLGEFSGGEPEPSAWRSEYLIETLFWNGETAIAVDLALRMQAEMLANFGTDRWLTRASDMHDPTGKKLAQSIVFLAGVAPRTLSTQAHRLARMVNLAFVSLQDWHFSRGGKMGEMFVDSSMKSLGAVEDCFLGLAAHSEYRYLCRFNYATEALRLWALAVLASWQGRPSAVWSHRWAIDGLAMFAAMREEIPNREVRAQVVDEFRGFEEDLVPIALSAALDESRETNDLIEMAVLAAEYRLARDLQVDLAVKQTDRLRRRTESLQRFLSRAMPASPAAVADATGSSSGSDSSVKFRRWIDRPYGDFGVLVRSVDPPSALRTDDGPYVDAFRGVARSFDSTVFVHFHVVWNSLTVFVWRYSTDGKIQISRIERRIDYEIMPAIESLYAEIENQISSGLIVASWQKLNARMTQMLAQIATTIGWNDITSAACKILGSCELPQLLISGSPGFGDIPFQALPSSQSVVVLQHLGFGWLRSAISESVDALGQISDPWLSYAHGSAADLALASEAHSIRQVCEDRGWNFYNCSSGRALDDVCLSWSNVCVFAGHGWRYHPRSPRGMGMLWPEGPVSAQNILDSPFSLFRCELALLSACSAGGMRPDNNEPMGYVAALQLSGAKRVVGAVWPVLDEVARRFSTTFLKSYLRDARVDNDVECAAKCYWGAVNRLRRLYPMEPLNWAPFVYWGLP